MSLSSPPYNRDAIEAEAEFDFDFTSLLAPEQRGEVDELQDATQDAWLTFRIRCELCKQRKVCMSRFYGDFNQSRPV